MVPLAMLSPPKFAYLSWRPWLFLMLADRIRRGERLGRNWPQAATFGNLGENRAGPQQTGQESPRSYMERRSKSSEGFALRNPGQIYDLGQGYLARKSRCNWSRSAGATSDTAQK